MACGMLVRSGDTRKQKKPVCQGVLFLASKSTALAKTLAFTRHAATREVLRDRVTAKHLSAATPTPWILARDGV
jgi:hypothetical protein